MTDNVNTLLCIAAGNGEDVKLKDLLKKNDGNVDLAFLNEEGNAALHCAVINGHENTVSLLLQAGSNVDLKDDVGNTPIFLAWKHGLSNIAKVLMNAGADVTGIDMSTIHLNVNDDEAEIAKGNSDLNWADEEEIAAEISSILTKLDENNVATSFKEAHRKKIEAATLKLSKLFEKQKLMSLADENDETLDALLLADANSKTVSDPNPASGAAGTGAPAAPVANTHKENVVQMMLQKKVGHLKKQLDAAEQKARSATLQWLSDKVRYKEEVDVLRQEKVAFLNKIQVLDKQVRQNEQLNRDKYMIEGKGDGEEMSETDKLKSMLFASDKELTEKKNALNEVTTEINVMRVEYKEAREKVEVLSNRVEEILKSEDSLNDQLDASEKARKEDTRKMAAMAEDYELIQSSIIADKERITELEKFLRELRQENEAVVTYLKKNLADCQAVVETLIREKEELANEMQQQLGSVRRELDYLHMEKDNLERDNKALMQTLSQAAVVNGAMQKDMMEFKRGVERALLDQRSTANSVERKLLCFSNNLTKILREAEERVAESKRQLQAFKDETAATIDSLNAQLKAANSKIKGLQYQVDNMQEIIRAAVATAVEEEVSRREAVEAELHAANITIDKLTMMVNEANAQKQEVEDALMASKRAKELVERDLVEAKEEINNCERQLMNLNAERQASDSEIAMLKTDAQQMQRSLDRSEAALVESRAREDEVSEQLAQNKEENVKLQEQLKVAVEEAATAAVAAAEAVSASIAAKSSPSLRNKPTGDSPSTVHYTSDPPSEKPKPVIDAEGNTIENILDVGSSLNVVGGFDIGMPDFVRRDDEVLPEEAEVVEPIRLVVSAERVEELVRQSVITDNYYFSQTTGTFTNDYPIDEAFVHDLINAFSTVGQNACKIVEKCTTVVANRFELTAQLQQDVEDLLLKSAKDLVINLQKSKEEAVDKFKIDMMRSEMDQHSSSSHATGHYSSTAPATTVTAAESSANHQKEVALKEAADAVQAELEFQLLACNEEIGLLRKQLTSMILQQKTQKPHGSSALSGEAMDDEISVGGDNSRASDFTTISSGQNLAEAQDHATSLTTEERASIEIEKEKKRLDDMAAALAADDAKKDAAFGVCSADELTALTAVTDDPLSKLATEPVDEKALKQLLTNGELFQLGEVRSENYERLKGKEFGPDELVSLTTLEHHLDHDGASGLNSVNARTYKMQLRSLEIQRDAIQGQVLQRCAVADLLAYKHTTERHIAMLDAMSAWRTIVYYKEGGQFKDVLLLHLKVIDRVISAAGGWQTALQSINEAGDASIATQQWPDSFRVKALEMLRLKLLKELADKKSRLENYHKMVHQRNTDEYFERRGTTMGDSMAETMRQRERTQSNGVPNSARSSNSGDNNGGASPMSKNGVPLDTRNKSSLVDSSSGAKSGLRPTLLRGGTRPTLLRGVSQVGMAGSSDSGGGQNGQNGQNVQSGDSGDSSLTGKGTLQSSAKPNGLPAPMARNSVLKRSATFSAANMGAAGHDLVPLAHNLPSVKENSRMNSPGGLDSASYSSDEVDPGGEQPVDNPRRPQPGAFLQKTPSMARNTFFQHQSFRGPSSAQMQSFSEGGGTILKAIDRNPLLARKISVLPSGSSQSNLQANQPFASNQSNQNIGSTAKQTGGKQQQQQQYALPTKQQSVTRQSASHEARYDEIIRGLHMNADKVVLGALYDEVNALELITKMADAIEAWHGNKQQSALQQLEACVKLTSGSNIVYDLMYLLETVAGRDMPNEVHEVYEKMVFILDYCAKRVAEKEEEEAAVEELREQFLAEKSAAVQAAVEESQSNTEAILRSASGDSEMINPLLALSTLKLFDTPEKKQEKLKQLREQSPLTVVMSSQQNVPEPQIVYIEAPKPTSFDCSTQTVMAESVVPSPESEVKMSQSFLQRSKTSRQSSSSKISPLVSPTITAPDVMPSSIVCAHVQEGEFEISPGITLATQNKLDMAMQQAQRGGKEFVMPAHVRYCIRSTGTEYDTKLKLAPAYLKVPVVPGCEAVLFPPVFPLQHGVHLLTNYRACSAVNVDLPKDVVVLQVFDNAELPRGLTMVELSPLIKANPEVLGDIQQGHQLVQILTGSDVALPVGLEVARGVRVAALPSTMELPPNLCIVRRQNQATLPEFMVPVGSTSGTEDESLFIHLRMHEGCSIVRKPEGVSFRLGMEILRRPQGMPLPPFMTLVPANEYPEGLVLASHLELVQLTPRFDFPPTCKISPTWLVLPRPTGMRVPPGVLIVYPDPLKMPAMPLPLFACPVCMPDIPYGVKLPALAIAVQLLHGSSDYALPEGVELAPGLTVVNLDRFLAASSACVSRPPTPNVLLVKRLNSAPLPVHIERGTRDDLPPGTLLSEHMEILRVPVRFELPAGVKLEVGAQPGPFTQLAPGNILSRYLEVVEWPYGLYLNQGTELVRVPSNYNLPPEFQLVTHTDTSVRLPTNTFIVKLPRSVEVTPPRVLSNKITVGIESMVADKSLPLPPGVIFASRESKKQLWPAEIVPLPRSALHHRVLQALDKLNSEASIGNSKLTSKSSSAQTGAGMNIEAVQLVPYFCLPPGAEIVPGVIVLQKPFWLHTPRWVELVSIPPNNPDIVLGKGVSRIKLRPEYMSLDASFSGESDSLFGDTVMKLPENSVLVQISESFEMYSWGPYLPGVEAVMLPRGKVFLPRNHYLIERPLRKRGEELPPGFKVGLYTEFKDLHLPVLDPNVEVMHIVPSFHLPPGVNVINSSVICKNSFNTSPLTNSGRFDLNWVPQLSAGDYIASGCSVLQHPICNKVLCDLLVSDPYMLREPHAFVRLDNHHLFTLPSNFSFHTKSDDIVRAIYGNVVHMIKLVKVNNGLPSPQDRFKKDYGTARFAESSHQMQRALTSRALQLAVDPPSHCIPNLHIEVFRVLTKLTKDDPRPDNLINSLLTRLSVFRLNDKKNKDDYKLLKKSNEFNLLDATLTKLKDTADSLDNANAWLKKTIENHMIENQALAEANAAYEERNNELEVQHVYDADLKAIVQRLNQKLQEKTHELAEYLAMRDVNTDRQSAQIEVLTTQLADWNSGKLNPEAAASGGGAEAAVIAAQSAAAAATVRAETEQQLKAVQQASRSLLNGISQQYCDSLVSLMDRIDSVVPLGAVPQNSAFIAMDKTPRREVVFCDESLASTSKEVAEDHNDGNSSVQSSLYARVDSPTEFSRPYPAISYSDEEGDATSVHQGSVVSRLQIDEDDISLLTDGADRMLAIALAGRIKPKEVGRKPQSMTLSSFQKSAASAEEDQYVSFTRSILGKDGQPVGGGEFAVAKRNGRKKGGNLPSKVLPGLEIPTSQRPISPELQLSKSVDNLLGKVRKGTAAQQQHARLPRLHDDLDSPVRSIVGLGGDTAVRVHHAASEAKHSDTFKDANYELLVAENHKKHMDALKSAVVMEAEQTFIVVDKLVSEAVSATFALPLASSDSDAKESHVAAEKSLNSVVLNSLKGGLTAISAKVVEYFAYVHAVERTRYVKALQTLEHEIKCLLRTAKTTESRCELLQCLLSEAKNRNNDYGQIANEGLRERIWILETKIEKLTDAQLKPEISSLQSQLDNLQLLVDLEKGLKFTSLSLKQRAAQEEAECRESHLNRPDADMKDIVKEKKASKHLCVSLRNKAKEYKERSERVHVEIEAAVSSILELAQSYERSVQAVIPTRLQSKLLKIGARYFDTIDIEGKLQLLTHPTASATPFTGGATNQHYAQQSVGGGDDQSLSFSVGNSVDQQSLSGSVMSTYTTGTSRSVSSKPSVQQSNSIYSQRVLEDATKTLHSSKVKFGAIGSMPPATSHHHLTGGSSRTAHTTQSGHNNRPGVK